MYFYESISHFYNMTSLNQQYMFSFVSNSLIDIHSFKIENTLLNNEKQIVYVSDSKLDIDEMLIEDFMIDDSQVSSLENGLIFSKLVGDITLTNSIYKDSNVKLLVNNN